MAAPYIQAYKHDSHHPFLMLQCSSADVLKQKIGLYSCGKNIEILVSKFYPPKIHSFIQLHIKILLCDQYTQGGDSLEDS